MNLFQRYLAEEFAEEYEEGHLSQREALKLIASVTGSVILANSILAACVPPDPSAINSPSATAAATDSSEDPQATSTNTTEGDQTPAGTAADPPTPTAAEGLENPAIEAAMAQSNKIYEKVIYPDTDHALNNDTGTRYAPEAAMDAWARTLEWFEKYL